VGELVPYFSTLLPFENLPYEEKLGRLLEFCEYIKRESARDIQALTSLTSSLDFETTLPKVLSEIREYLPTYTSDEAWRGYSPSQKAEYLERFSDFLFNVISKVNSLDPSLFAKLDALDLGVQ
jgi:hypothetical protein